MRQTFEPWHTCSAMLVLVATSLALAGLLAAGTAATAADWPHWRGPQHNGTSAETGLPVEWGPDRNIAWKVAMPDRSGSTPIISGDLVFLNVAHGEELELWALRREDGREVWRRPLGGGNFVARKHNMSSPSPVTDGEHVWILAGTGRLAAFDFAGKEVWSRNLQEDYGPFGLNHGYGSSPLLDNGTLYVQVLHGMKTDDPSYVLAIDPTSGTTRWRQERPTDARMESPDSYTTPAMVRVGERTELVITGGDYVTGHDPATGAETWRIGGLNPDDSPMYRIVASPVVAGDLVFVPSRVSPLLVLRVPEKGKPEIAWTLDKGPDVPTPASDGRVVYVVNDRGIMSRHEAATGKTDWEGQRLRAGTYSASPVVADGKVYVTSEDGTTSVVEDAPKFGLLAENELEGYTLSSFAIADGKLFLRTDKYLYCIGK